MRGWGPADWYVAGAVVVGLLGLFVGALFALTDWLPQWWRDLRTPPSEVDPRDKLPYIKSESERSDS